MTTLVDFLGLAVPGMTQAKVIANKNYLKCHAEQAYNILRNAGYNARFLNDKAAISENKVFCCYK